MNICSYIHYTFIIELLQQKRSNFTLLQYKLNIITFITSLYKQEDSFVNNLAPLPHLAQTARLGSWVFHHANFFTSHLFCTQPDLARGRARQACPILVYQNRISGRATSRCIVHGRCETEDWPQSMRIIRAAA